MSEFRLVVQYRTAYFKELKKLVNWGHQSELNNYEITTSYLKLQICYPKQSLNYWPQMSPVQNLVKTRSWKCSNIVQSTETVFSWINFLTKIGSCSAKVICQAWLIIFFTYFSNLWRATLFQHSKTQANCFFRITIGV